MYHVQRAVSYPAGHTMGSNPVGPEGATGEVGAGTVGVGGGTVGGGTEGPDGEDPNGRMTFGSPCGSMQVSGMPS